MNRSKSSTIIFSRAPTECNLEIEGERVKNVKETVYLGVKLSEDGMLESEVERRIGMTMQAVGTMKKVYESREISREAKVAVFKAVAVLTPTYGCESWVLKEREKSRLQAAELRVLRKIAGVSRLSHVRNETGEGEAKSRTSIKESGKDERMLEGEGGEQEGKCGGKGADREGIGRRPRGCPRKRWRDPF